MHEAIREKCEQILSSLAAIEEYISSITSAEDFFVTKEGQLRLDAITMRFQVVGENVKQIERLQPHFFWTNLLYDIGYIARFRDFISHHYERLDHEIVYRICASKLPAFRQALNEFLQSR